MKRRSGITLISLVVTIIVLLILAGIVLSFTLGKDGIISKAQQAGKNYVDASQYEKEQLSNLTNKMEEMIENVVSPKSGSIEVQVSAEDNMVTNFQGVTISITNGQENYQYTLKENENKYRFDQLEYGKEYEVKISDLMTDCYTFNTPESVSISLNQETMAVDFKFTCSGIYLYRDGNECENNSGLWSSIQYEGRPTTFSKEDTYLYINSTVPTAAGYYYTNHEIDFFQYSKLRVKWVKNKTRYDSHFTVEAGTFNLREGKPGTYSDANTYTYTDRNYLTTDLEQEKEEELEFDISNLQSKGSIYLYVYHGTLKIREVYLEK